MSIIEPMQVSNLDRNDASTTPEPSLFEGELTMTDDGAVSSANGADNAVALERKRLQRPYPACAFTEALAIGQGIVQHAGGQKVRRLTLLEKMGLNQSSSSTRQKITDSGKYKITKGSYNADYLELTPDGAVVSDDTSPARKRLEASFGLAIAGIAPFSFIYEASKDKRLPAKEVLADLLHESNHGVTDTDECIETFLANARHIGLVRKIGNVETLVSIEAVLEQTQDEPSKEVRLSGSLQSRRSESVTVAVPPSGSADRICFVIMPFTERDEEHHDGFFNEVLSSILTPAVASAGFTVRTARRKGSDVIQATIVRELLDADLVLADLTEHNPNVLFELGMRMHADKPVVLVKAKGTGRIFDVDSMLRVEEYDPRLWPTTVSIDVPKIADHVKGAWEGREGQATFMRILRQPQASMPG